MQNEKELFARNLKRRRTELHFSQVRLAEKIMYTGKAISKWESGLALPPAEVLPSLARALETDLNSLFDFRESPSYFLGIDGGGTKTRFMLTDRNGVVLKVLTLGACNPASVGFDKCIAVLREGLKSVCGRIPYGKISVCGGIAGAGVGKNAKEMEFAFQEMGFSRLKICPDTDNIVSAGLEGRDGIIAILGTGSIILAVENGTRHRIGGYGHLIGDVFSGTEFGRSCLEAVFYDLDKSGRHTSMTGAVMEKTGKSVPEILTDIYSGGKIYIAGFAPVFFQCAEEGDDVALEILQRSIEKFAGMLAAAIRSFSFGTTKIPIVLAGGITNYSQDFLDRLIRKVPSERLESISILNRDPVVGAVLLAGAERVEEEKNA